MKSPTESTLTLEAVAEHFEQWRRSKMKRERIPEKLWREAIDLLGHYGVSQVTRTLRLSGSDLNKRRGMVGAARRRKNADVKVANAGAAFVEVARQAVAQASGLNGAAGWLELHRPDGMRLHIHPSDGSELLALVDRFMGC